MDNTLDAKKQQVMKMLKNEVSKYTKDGSSLPQAISLTCKKLGLNPYNIIRQYFPEIKEEDIEGYKDIKTNEGSFVTLKGDSSQTHYEVININNKDAIVLRNADNNQEITASEDEITPVITENKMDKLNEAQYSVSINGLETTDAAALSQMLSSAAQAEQTSGVATEPMAINPEPMDVATGMPMDMGAGLPEPSLDMPMDSTLPDESLPTEDLGIEEPEIEDDIEFDEELPNGEEISLDADANAYANPEMDTAVVPTDSLEDNEEPAEAEPVDNEDELEPANDFGGESIEDMSMDDMIDDGMYEGFDYDALIKEALEAAGLNESEETIPASDDVEDDGSLNGSQEDYAEEITEGRKKCCHTHGKEECCHTHGKEECVCEEDSSFDDEIAEALRLAGVELTENEDEDSEEEKEELDEGNAEINAGDNINLDTDETFDDEITEGAWDKMTSRQQKIMSYVKRWCENIASDAGYLTNEDIIGISEDVDMKPNELKRLIKKLGFTVKEEKDLNSNLDETFDDEIAEALRLAGVELNEAEATLPTPVDEKTLYANKEAEKNEDLAPEYHEVDTTPFSKESSEGFKLTLEAAVKTDKVKRIYETAKSMYAKKDVSDWMTLDRRYITKLIKEGVGYEKAYKILTSAKKGK